MDEHLGRCGPAEPVAEYGSAVAPVAQLARAPQHLSGSVQVRVLPGASVLDRGDKHSAILHPTFYRTKVQPFAEFLDYGTAFCD
jgi:hypothetical protein